MEPKEILEKLGVLKKGHFLLTSGNHSDTYFEKYRILSNPYYLHKLLEFSFDFIDKIDFDVIIGPFTGGALIAEILGLVKNKRTIFAEKDKEGFVIRRDFGISYPVKALIVDDVITTGGSVKKVISAAKDIAEIRGILVLIDRREEKEEFPYPFYSIYKEKVKIYSPSECPLCKGNIPLLKPGGKT